MSPDIHPQPQPQTPETPALKRRGRGRPTKTEKLIRYLHDPFLYKKKPPRTKKLRGQDVTLLKLGLRGINYGLDNWACLPKHTPNLYKIWLEMGQVCYNKEHPYYEVIGRHGVLVCEDWRHGHDYKQFEAWAKEAGFYNNQKPPCQTLCRHDAFGDFSPANCYWGDYREAAPILYRGYTIDRWCYDRREISAEAVRRRIDRGWAVSDAFKFGRKKGKKRMTNPKEILFAEALDAMSKRIQWLESENKASREVLDRLCKVILPQLVSTVRELKEGRCCCSSANLTLASTPPTPELAQRMPSPVMSYIPTRIKTSYKTWCDIFNLRLNSGKNDREISRELGIPYSTVRKYLYWTPEKVQDYREREYVNQDALADMLEIERRVFGEEALTPETPETPETPCWENDSLGRLLHFNRMLSKNKKYIDSE